MTTVAAKARVTREPVEVTRARLRAFIARLEHRYECPTDAMLARVTVGEVRETAELARWLLSYRTLESLGADGGTTGTRTSGIA